MKIQDLQHSTVFVIPHKNRIKVDGINDRITGRQSLGIRMHKGFYARFKVFFGLAERITIKRIKYVVNKNSFAKWAKRNKQQLENCQAIAMIEIGAENFGVSDLDAEDAKADHLMGDAEDYIMAHEKLLKGEMIVETSLELFTGTPKEAEDKWLAKLQIVPFQDPRTKAS